MKDIFNFFKTPSYKKADIILEKDIEEKKKLNKKMIIILIIAEIISVLALALNPFGLMVIKLLFGIENTTLSILSYALMNGIILFIITMIIGGVAKITLDIFKIKKSFSESLFISLSPIFHLNIFTVIIGFISTIISYLTLYNLIGYGIISLLSIIISIISLVIAIWGIVAILVFYGNIFKSMGKGIGFLIVEGIILGFIYLGLGIILGNYAGLLNIF